MLAPRRRRCRAMGHPTPAATAEGRGIRGNAGGLAGRSSSVCGTPGKRQALVAAVRARTRYRRLGAARKNNRRNLSRVATHLRRRSKTKSASGPNPPPGKIVQHSTQPAILRNRHSPLPPLSPDQARTPRLARPHLRNPVSRCRFSSQLSLVTVPRPRDRRPHDKNRCSLKTFPPRRLCPPRVRSKSVSDYATYHDLARVDGPPLRVQAKSGSSAAASLQLFLRENIALDFCAYFQYITASLIHSQLVYELLYSSA